MCLASWYPCKGSSHCTLRTGRQYQPSKGLETTLQKAVTDSSLCGGGEGRAWEPRDSGQVRPPAVGDGGGESRGAYTAVGQRRAQQSHLSSPWRLRSGTADPEGRLTSCCPRERGQGSAQTLLLPGSLSKLPLPLSAPAALISETHHLTLLHLPLRSLKQSFSSLCKH